MPLVRFGMQLAGFDYRKRLMGLVAFLLRYGPKSVDEILNKPVSWNNELADSIGELMEREKTSFEQNLITGES
jgi:hypothetical protein